MSLIRKKIERNNREIRKLLNENKKLEKDLEKIEICSVCDGKPDLLFICVDCFKKMCEHCCNPIEVTEYANGLKYTTLYKVCLKCRK